MIIEINVPEFKIPQRILNLLFTNSTKEKVLDAATFSEMSWILKNRQGNESD